MAGNKNYWYLDVINVFLLVLIFFFGGAVISSQIILSDEMVYVPDIAGKTIDQARQELKKRDLGLAVSGYQFSEQVDRGRIISQDPAPGSRLKVNRQIQVVVGSGSESVTVPLYAGKSSIEQSTLDLRQTRRVAGTAVADSQPAIPGRKDNRPGPSGRDRG